MNQNRELQFRRTAEKALHDFVESVSPPDDLLILHHGDPDGVCAAALIHHWITHSINQPPPRLGWIGTHQFSFDLVPQMVRATHSRALLCLDINFTSAADGMDKASNISGVPVLIYDDHEISFPVHALPAHTTFLNPNATSSSGSYPASIFAYDLGGYDSTSRGALLASIGLFADHQYDNFQGPRGFAFSRNMLFDFSKLCSGYFLHSEATNYFDPVADALIAYLGSPGDFAETMREFELQRYSDDVSAEVDRLTFELSNRSANISVLPNDIVFLSGIIDSPYKVVNLVSSSVRNTLSRGIVFVAQPIGPKVIIEARRTRTLGTFDLKALLDRVVSKVPVLNYGGHQAAVGLGLSPENYRLFEITFQDEVKRVAQSFA